MSLTPQFLDELRARTLLSALVGRSVKLEKAGREFRACCPFHNEKTPSFYVNDDKGFYHCFGCSAHGDAIRFLTEARGLPFIDAVKELAAAAGMEVPAADPRARERAERATGLHDVMAAAAAWYEAQLDTIEGSDARAYLQQRGISDTQRRVFGLGFAPESRSKLKTALRAFGNDMLIEAGLLISVDDKEPYDRFRGRLMIPIRDPRGRVIAFGGRILGAGEPKYLNSPETPLFDKGRTLYNLDRAAAASRKSGRLIVVEGYMDVIALDRAGISEAVAPLGTALTEGQLERLWRLTDAPILCFDGDGAGQKAAARAAQRALPMIAPGRSLRFATLPAGQDPDDLVKSGGAAAIEALLGRTEPLVDRIWGHALAAEPLDTPEARAGLRKRLAELTRTIDDGGVREQYAIDLGERFDALFGRKPQQAWQPAPRAPWQPGRPGSGKPRWTPPPRPTSAQSRAISMAGIDRMMVKAMFAGLIRYPDMIAGHAEAIGALPTGDPMLDRLRGALINAAFDGDALEPAIMTTILQNAGLGAMANDMLGTNGLAFSFIRSNSEPERARRDLGEVIELLATRPALDRSLAEATRRLEADADDAAFAEQQRLSRAMQDAEMRLMALASGEDGAAL